MEPRHVQPWDINLRHLRAFVKTCEMGSLVAASKSVNMSQPAMTQAISRLENLLDIRLFDRRLKGMTPTAPANLILPRARAALEFIRSKHVTATQIKAFLALMRGGSYTDAHRITGLARASLHRAVNDLELALKVKLVRRRGRGLDVTENGRATFQRYGLAETELRAALEEGRRFKGERAGRIAIGAMPLSRARVLPEAIVAFQLRYPDCELYVAEGSYAELMEPLRHGELDFLIGAVRDPAPAPDIVQSPLFDDWPVIIASQKHELIHRPTLEELSQYDWCMPRAGVPLRDNWEQMFLMAALDVPKVRVECGSVMTIRQVLLQTNCLTVLSPDQVSVELEAQWLKIIGNTSEVMRRVIGVTHRENWRPTETQKAMLECLDNVSKLT